MHAALHAACSLRHLSRASGLRRLPPYACSLPCSTSMTKNASCMPAQGAAAPGRTSECFRCLSWRIWRAITCKVNALLKRCLMPKVPLTHQCKPTLAATCAL